MAWVHDTGYALAYEHTGYPVSILLDGTETASSSARTAAEAIGWRSACDCGWRGMQFYPRSEWPSASGIASDDVDGWESGTATFAEWQCHLARALPELAVHDLARQLAEIEERLQAAVHAARFAGLSWSRLRAVTSRATAGSVRLRGMADEQARVTSRGGRLDLAPQAGGEGEGLGGPSPS
ncbi:hypothetical protein ACVGOW_23585 [Pseudonocardia saturnea]